MTVVPVTLSIVVTLWESPAAFDLIDLKRAMLAALLEAFNRRRDFWTFSTDSLSGEIQEVALGAVQAATITPSPTPPTASFVAVLPRYTLAGTDVTISFQGPS